MNDQQLRILLEKIAELLELPENAYESAIKRYTNIGEWFDRDESSCSENNTQIFPQGSFRLGTAIRPLIGDESYDLDLACNLRAGISCETHTQAQLKNKVGAELELYRIARGIKEKLESKHRCWRLEYADGLSFHMDIVPCIPAEESSRKNLLRLVESRGMKSELAQNVTELAVNITDDRLPNFRLISPDWMVSNPEGYAKWFESKMKSSLLAELMEKAQVDKVPLYKRKTPLQRSVQILKRHRDVMFKDDPDVKPISIIITTIAASACSGGETLFEAMTKIINALRVFAESKSTVVPNPVNPEENFADRWTMPKYKDLQLQENFINWVQQVTIDFEYLSTLSDVQKLVEAVKSRFSVHPTADTLSKALGLALGPAVAAKAKDIESVPSKPWLS